MGETLESQVSQDQEVPQEKEKQVAFAKKQDVQVHEAVSAVNVIFKVEQHFVWVSFLPKSYQKESQSRRK